MNISADPSTPAPATSAEGASAVAEPAPQPHHPPQLQALPVAPVSGTTAGVQAAVLAPTVVLQADPAAPGAMAAPPGIQLAELTRYLVDTGVIPAPQTEAERAAEARGQRLLVLALIAVVFAVHLPWLAYLVAAHGCWGGFVEGCLSPEADGGTMLFAQIAFGILRVQSVLAVDVAKFSEVMQLSTGVGAFVLARIAAANGQIVEAGARRYALAGICAICFGLLFWAELHLTGTTRYPVLGDLTVLEYIDFETPLDIPPGDVEPGLLRYLQILRLADAMIFGAALALLKPAKAKR